MVKDSASYSNELRRHAEERLKNMQMAMPASDAEMQKLLHELQVRQIELEMQVQELRYAETIANATLTRYIDIYDFTPVAYFTLAFDGTIHMANLTGAAMLAPERSKLIGQRLASFVAAESLLALRTFLQEAFMVHKTGPQKVECELTVANHGGVRRYVHLAGLSAEGCGECRTVMTDITERKEYEEALRRESYKNQMLMRLASDGIHVMDINGNVLQANDAFCRMLGYSPEEIQSMNVSQWDAQWSGGEIKEKLDQLIKQGAVWVFNTKHRCRDGRVMDVEISTVAVEIDGKPLVYASSRDITERKRIEEALRESEFFFKESQRAASIGSYKVDFIADLWESSELLDQIFGIDKGYSRSVRGWLDLIIPEDREMMDRYLKEEVISRHKPFNKEYRIIRKSDGETRWVLGLGKIDFDAEGNTISMLGTIQDITERKQIEEALRESNNLNQSLIRSIPLGIDIIDEQGNILYMAPYIEKIFKKARVGEKCWLVYSDDCQQHADCPLKQPIQIGESKCLECAGVLGGKVYEFIYTGIIYKGKPAILKVFRDITERKRLQEALKESEAQARSLSESLTLTLDELNSIMEANPDILYVINTEGELIQWNSNLEKFCGIAHGQMLNMQAGDLICEEDRPILTKGIMSAFQNGTSTIDVRFIRHDGALVPFMCSGVVLLRHTNGEVMGFLGTGRDISERKANEEKIRHLANFDTLTDLPNRALFFDRLQQALATAKRDKARLAVMFLDLDMFKPVNDTFGHEVGDLLLKEAAQRMQGCVRESDTVARLGGDEFVVLLLSVEEERDARVVAEKIRHALNQPFKIAGHSLHISSSIGIAVYPENGSNDKVLLKNADTAMYYAKESGRNIVKSFPTI